MAYTGVFATEAELNFKAGENVDATGWTEANKNLIMLDVESYINVLCRFNFTDNYSTLNADVRHILSEAASNMAAIYGIQYNMAGFTTRIEAEDMINILYRRFKDCIKVLNEAKNVFYMDNA